MISINYQKLTANMLTGDNLRHYHKGESKATALLWQFSQREDLRENSDSWAPHPQVCWVPLKVWPGTLHFSIHRIVILQADSQKNFFPDILTSPWYNSPFFTVTPLFGQCPLPGMPSHCLCLENSNIFKRVKLLFSFVGGAPRPHRLHT